MQSYKLFSMSYPNPIEYAVPNSLQKSPSCESVIRDKIVPQPFTRETIDNEDVEFEEYNLELDTLFPDSKTQRND